jgi:hypothetical protein
VKISVKTKYLIPVGCIATGGLFALLSATQYELWHPTKGPMPGFFPFLCGLLLLCAGIAGIFQARRDAEPDFQLDNWLLVACVFAVIGANYIIGFLPSLFLFSFGWLKLKERCSWKITLITMVVLLIIILGIFQFWLEIPFEKGLLFRNLLK